tara:strand:+ start:2461 stop:3117 length:657 start_codon:yes stop_codon:yes gene_type:complete
MGEKELNIHDKLSQIQTELKTAKSRFNGFGNYNYRSAEDILEAIKPYLIKLGCTCIISEELIQFDNTPWATKKLKDGAEVPTLTAVPILKSIATLTDTSTGMIVQAEAIVGVDLAQKGMQVPQAFGAASSYGKKYSLGNLFLIDDTKDADGINTHGKSEAAKVPAVVAPRKKPTLAGTALEKAKTAITAGTFTLEKIENKYTISAATKVMLQGLTVKA